MSLIQLPFDGLDFEWRMLEDGRIVVRADEVCIALGWQKTDISRVIQTKIFAEYRFQESFGMVGKPPWYLHEPGVWQLIFQSNSAIAEKFQRWVFEEVIPKLRAEGYYRSFTISQQQLKDEIVSGVKLLLQEEFKDAQRLIQAEMSRLEEIDKELRSYDRANDFKLMDLSKAINELKNSSERQLLIESYRRRYGDYRLEQLETQLSSIKSEYYQKFSQTLFKHIGKNMMLYLQKQISRGHLLLPGTGL